MSRISSASRVVAAGHLARAGVHPYYAEIAVDAAAAVLQAGDGEVLARAVLQLVSTDREAVTSALWVLQNQH